MSSIVGVPIGIVLILVACGVLYWNEGRVDYSRIAQKSVPVAADQVDQSHNNQFVSVTGTLSTSQQLGDGDYLLPGAYVAVQRKVEEYAWVEHSKTQSQSNLGGSSTNTTTYTYTQEWTDHPADSSSFQEPQGHQNPAKPLDDSLSRAQSAKIGAYSFDPGTVTLPTLQPITLSQDNVKLPAPATAPATATAPASAAPQSKVVLANSQYIYSGTGILSSPQIGDVRISYLSLPSGATATVFGQLSGSNLQTYTDSANHTFYAVLFGDRQTAIATLHAQYVSSLWLFRGLGLLLIWFGLMMIMGPLDTLLDFIPILGEVGTVMSAIISIPVALVLGGTVILISYTLHHLLALIIGVPIMLAVCVGIFKLIKKGRGIPTRGAAAAAVAQTPQMPVAPAAASGSLFAAPAVPAPVQPAVSPVLPPAEPIPPQASQTTPPTEPPVGQ